MTVHGSAARLRRFRNRISNLSEQGGEESVVPGGAFDFAAVGNSGFLGIEDIDGQVAEDGEVVRPLVEPVSRA